MSIKDTLTSNSMNSFSFGGKTYTRRVDNGAVVYDISAGTDGSAFSTGWVNTDGTTPVANGATLTFDHNLGTTDLVVDIYVSSNADGSNPQDFQRGHATGTASAYGGGVTNITANTLEIQLASVGYLDLNSSGGVTTTGFSGKYIKVVVSAKMGSGGGGEGGGGASVTTDETAPTNPSDGDLWYDESSAALYVYTDSIGGWIQANGGGGGGTGTRAYVAFDGTAADLTGSITNSFNVSSITDHQAGQYTVTFTSPVPNPVAVHDNGPRSDGYPIMYSDLYNVGSNSIKIALGSNNIWYDSPYISLIVF